MTPSAASSGSHVGVKTGKKEPYQYDPHLDAQLVWAGRVCPTLRVAKGGEPKHSQHKSVL